MGESQEATQYNYKEIQKNLNDLLNQVEDIKGDISKAKENIKGIEDNFENVKGKIVTAKQMIEEPIGTKPKCIIKSLCDEFAKIFQNKTQERKKTKENSVYLSAENIYDEFRSTYTKSFVVPFICIEIGAILFYLILFFIFRLKLEHNNLTCIPLIVKNILILLMPILCGIFFVWKSIRNDTKAEKTIFILLICIMWIVFIILFMLCLKEVPRKIVFLFDLFFFLLFIISLIDYESANYTDSEKDKAKTKLLDIVNNKGLDNENPYFYDLLVNYSNDIEDSLVSAIRKLKNWVNVLFIGGLFSANIEVLKGFFKSIDEFTLELSIEVFFYQIFMADFLLVIALSFFALYKFLNWKSNFYRTILQEIQFSFVIKKELKLQERR